MSLTINETGKVLTVTEQGVEMPADYSFDTVNDYVHRLDTNYEDLEALCLGMANHMDKLYRLLLETNGYLMTLPDSVEGTKGYREDLIKRQRALLNYQVD